MDKVILITLFLALLAPLLIRIKLSYDKKLIKKIRGMVGLFILTGIPLY